MNDIIELSKEEIAYGEGYVEGLKDAKAERDAAIAAAVAEAVAKETERCIMALENIDILGVNQRERSISEHTINSGAAAIRNGSAASKVTRNSAGEHQIRKDKQS